jgi:5'-nucleotidase
MGKFRPRLLIDCDGILADFDRHTEESVRKHGIELPKKRSWDIFEVLTPALKREVLNYWRMPGWARSMPVLPGAQRAIEQLQQIGEVYVVTSPMPRSTTWCHDREWWLDEHFGIDRKRIVFTPAKELIRGDMLLDDKPEHVIEWRKEFPDGLALFWEHEWARAVPTHGMAVRINAWDSVVTHALWMAEGA